MGKKYRLLGCFVGNAETGHGSTGIGSLPSDFKVLFCRKIGNIADRYSECGFQTILEEFDPVAKLTHDVATVSFFYLPSARRTSLTT